jgi:MraZ protein
MFNGSYTHSVDAKGRVAIPVRFRLQLEEGAVLTNWIDGCAAIFPRSEFEEFARKVKDLPLADERARSFALFVFRSAFDIETDAQGRVVLPASVREWAGLASEVVVVGHFDHLEIWDPQRLAKAQQGIDSASGLASQIAGLGI